MPEIPDLEAIRGFLNERLPGQTVDAVEVNIPHVVRTGATALAESLPGDAFGEAERRGKFLLFALASGRVLAVNPMLTGRFQYAPPEAKRQGRTCLRLSLSGGMELRYADLRVMGRLYLLPLEELAAIPNWSAGGPDLLDPALTEEVWLERIRKYRGRIKNVLIKAEFVQGVGNAYSDEILWEARINPFTARTDLDDGDLRRLFAAARGGDGVGDAPRARAHGEGRHARLPRAARLLPRAPPRRGGALPARRREDHGHRGEQEGDELLPHLPAGRPRLLVAPDA